MTAEIKIIVGLGNPGHRYENTRHNAGFMLTERIAGEFGAVPFKNWQNLGEYSEFTHEGKTVFLVRPLTFMNNSGHMTSSFSRYKKIKPEEILVCFDDLSLNCGQIRIRAKGSSGGQKGMKNIIELLASENLPRIKIGIGPKPHPNFDTSSFVLSNFSADEKLLLNESLDKALKAVKTILAQGLEKAMNLYN